MVHSPILTLENISKRYGAFALSNFIFSLVEGEIVSIIGESGSGKSILLKIIAGIEKPDGGNIYYCGKNINELPAEKRPFRMVWQDLLLFPHMDVYKNLEFGLKINKIAPREREQRILEAIKILGIEGKLHANIATLSGGEKQRVAIARALVLKPKILLLDEPFSALDAQTSANLQQEIRKLKEKYNLTILIVTHIISDALLMSNRIIVLRNGNIQQIGNPKEIFTTPINRYVAEFVGKMNVIQATLQSKNGKQLTFATDIGNVNVLSSLGKLKEGRKGAIVIRPDLIKTSQEKPALLENVFRVIFKREELVGSIIYQYFELSNKQNIVVEKHASANPQRHAPEESVYVSWKPEQAKVIFHLNILCWIGYEEENVIRSFEEQHGVKVDAHTYYNADQMVSMLQEANGHYDVVIADLEYLPRLYNHLQPIHVTSLELQFIHPFFQTRLYKREDKIYAIPIRYGTNALVYNTKYLTKNDVSSYNILFQKKLQGKIGIWNWYLPIMGCLSLFLRYKNPFQIADKDFQKLKQLLFILQKNVKIYETPLEIREAFIKEEIILAPGVGLHLVAADLKLHDYPVEESIPQEGAILWTELAAIPSNSGNPQLAHSFIQHLLSPQIQAKLAVSKAYKSGVTNLKALEYIPAREKKDLKLESKEEMADYLARLIPREIPPHEDLWKAAWNRFCKNL